jgi:hypothetical protein
VKEPVGVAPAPFPLPLDIAPAVFRMPLETAPPVLGMPLATASPRDDQGIATSLAVARPTREENVKNTGFFIVFFSYARFLGTQNLLNNYLLMKAIQQRYNSTSFDIPSALHYALCI